MALSQSFLSSDQLRCSICLDIFTNPVSTPCGHSFCMACIGRYWDGSKASQCPVCKEVFSSRPELHINRTLREITEQFKGMLGCDLQSAPVGLAKPREILAEMNRRLRTMSLSGQDGESQKAFGKTPHSTPKLLSPTPCPRLALRRFTLGVPGDSRQVPLCQKHQRRLWLFCEIDQTCICEECAEAEHLEHDVIRAESDWLVSKSQLGATEREIEEMIQDRVKKMEAMRTVMVDMNAAVKKEQKGIVEVFTSLVSSIKRSQEELMEIVQTNLQTAERWSQGLILELEQEVEMLRERRAALMKLLRAKESIFYMKSDPVLCSPPDTTDWSDVCMTPDVNTGAVHMMVSHLVERFQDELRRLPEISVRVPLESSPSCSRPKTRMIQEYAVDINLDPNTAHPRLLVSQDGKQVRCAETYQNVADNPKRFDRVFCLLGLEGFNTGRHYWEVEVRGKTEWDLGVARCTVKRKGKVTVDPRHGYWFLSLREKNGGNSLGLEGNPQRIGVYLDYEKGQVSFYNVEAKIHIHTFNDTFADSVYPFFSPGTNKTGRNGAPLVITPVTHTYYYGV